MTGLETATAPELASPGAVSIHSDLAITYGAEFYSISCRRATSAAPFFVEDTAPMNTLVTQRAEQHAPLAPNYEMARRQFRTLARDIEAVTFQAFDDDPARRDRRLARIFHGSGHGADLASLNARRAGIFFSTNPMNGSGRSATHLLRIDAVIADFDEGVPPRVSIEPTLRLQTSVDRLTGRVREQWLWRLADSEVLTHEQQRAVMDRLTAPVTEGGYGADPRAKDPTRLGRVAGFYHCKREPQLVTIVGDKGPRPRSAEMVAAFPAPAPRISQRATESAVRPFRPVIPQGLERFDAPLSAVAPDDYAAWTEVGMALYGETGGSAAGLSTWEVWSARSEKYRPGQCAAKWRSFSRYGGRRATGGKIFWLASQHGWQPERRAAA